MGRILTLEDSRTSKCATPYIVHDHRTSRGDRLNNNHAIALAETREEDNPQSSNNPKDQQPMARSQHDHANVVVNFPLNRRTLSPRQQATSRHQENDQRSHETLGEATGYFYIIESAKHKKNLSILRIALMHIPLRLVLHNRRDINRNRPDHNTLLRNSLGDNALLYTQRNHTHTISATQNKFS